MIFVEHVSEDDLERYLRDKGYYGCVAEFMGRKAIPGERIRKRDCSEAHAGVGLGDSVPEPLGFIAFTPECWFYTEGT